MARVAALISIDDFKAKFKEAILTSKHFKEYEDEIEEDPTISDDQTLNRLHRVFFEFTKYKDLGKVDFDTENFECIPDKVGGDVYGYKYGGFQTLENGLTFLGCAAGGDWQDPVFFIFYYDGKRFRGYIPKDGNSWDPKTKAAYEDSNFVHDDAKIIEDIKARITVK